MGLDMMAYAVDPTVKQDKGVNIAEWRKHPNLHGWMEQLWRERTDSREDFNCQEVELTLKDLKALEVAIMMGQLPETTGFFYGTSSDSYYKSTDLAFIDESRALLKKGKKVFYNSWW